MSRKNGTRRLSKINDQRIFKIVDTASSELVKDLKKYLIEQIA
jgi:hypothetical protein